MASGRLHHAWLLAGPRGVGKGSFARAAARRLLAEAAGPPPDGDGLDVRNGHRVASLLEAGSHPDFRLLERLPKTTGTDLARSISVDQVRGLASLLGSTPFLSRWRAVVIDSIDDLERPAANALLKALEEPPANCLFLLVSHAPGALLPTIRSRCRTVRFGRLGDADMAAALKAALPDAAAGEIETLVKVGEGAPGLAVARRGLGLDAIDADLARLSRDGDRSNELSSALSAKLAGKAAQLRYELFLERAPSHIVAAARSRSGLPLARALRLWERAATLAVEARALSLDPAAVTFCLAGLVAGLAPEKGHG